MNKNQLKKQFIELLREHNAITAYCAGLAYPKWDYPLNTPRSLSEMLNQLLPTNWLFFAFDWENSSNGYLYWQTINTIWNAKIMA